MALHVKTIRLKALDTYEMRIHLALRHVSNSLQFSGASKGKVALVSFLCSQ